MEGIARITTLKMQNEKINGYVTVIADGEEYEAKFTHESKMPVYSKVKNIAEFIKDAMDHEWKITLMEVE